ncbi:hypothetical protein IT400_01590 [Candidatus Nomurabacteria bacterium]|nr:hypothetical protein [Candidatus Nomurabacteria bacterium]
MSITIDKEFKLDTLWFLKVVASYLRNNIDSPADIEFPFDGKKSYFSVTGETPSLSRQKAVISYLEKQEVLKWQNLLLIGFDKEHRKKWGFDGTPITSEKSVLVVDEKKFNKLYTKYQALDKKVVAKNPLERYGGEVQRIDILEDPKRQGRVKIYINENYHKELDFSRNIRWGGLYDLAERKSINHDRNILSYFNSQQTNPLYARHGFTVTKILKVRDGKIVSNIKIGIITQPKLTRKLQAA